MVNILSAQGSVLSEVAFNSETGCMGANTVKVGLRPLCNTPAGYTEVHATALARVFRISRGLSRYSIMSEVFAPRYLAGLVSTNG